MDVERVREAAELHVSAIVEGRLQDAVSVVVKEGRAEIKANLERLPRPVAGAVESVREDHGQFVVLMSFKTSPSDEFGVILETHWAEVDGKPELHQGYVL